MSEFWKHVVIAGAIFLAATLIARVIDRRLQRQPLPPEAVTRYRVLRRIIMATIIVVGLFSALLAIPEVRAVAGALLASSALIGIVVGFASQRTLGNVIAGLLIGLAQPVRIGDRVEYAGAEGTVEEIGLTYTFIRGLDRRRIVVPNEKLASDTIVNASIRGRETFAEVSVPLPLDVDLEGALVVLREVISDERSADVYVASLDGTATVMIRAAAPDEVAAERLEHELRLRAHRRLRTLGVWA
jgi:small-conductance mechanosensitive channel